MNPCKDEMTMKLGLRTRTFVFISLRIFTAVFLFLSTMKCECGEVYATELEFDLPLVNPFIYNVFYVINQYNNFYFSCTMMNQWRAIEYIHSPIMHDLKHQGLDKQIQIQIIYNGLLECKYYELNITQNRFLLHVLQDEVETCNREVLFHAKEMDKQDQAMIAKLRSLFDYLIKKWGKQREFSQDLLGSRVPYLYIIYKRHGKWNMIMIDHSLGQESASIHDLLILIQKLVSNCEKGLQ